jgi:kinesin family protein 5
MQLDEVKEQYKVVAKSAHSKTQAKKLGFLEHNLEQLNSVQKQLVEQNSALKKEAAIAERKLMTRNDRIANLETLLSAADARLTAKSQKVEQQLQALRDRLESARGGFRELGSLTSAGNPSPVNFGRIAKPVRGGQGDESASSELLVIVQANVRQTPYVHFVYHAD